jgi:hypothetical protein
MRVTYQPLVLAVTLALAVAPASGVLGQTIKPGSRAPKPPEIRKVTPGMRVIGQTWVKTGFFNEIDQTEHSSTTISEPTALRFKWGTTLKQAEEGFWRLRRKSGPDQFSLVATGVATAGTGGLFRIDLKPYLPSSPPIDPAIYHVEVVARLKSKTDKTTATSPGGGGTKIPAQELGVWSAPVVITYAIDTTPTTRFDFDHVYRKATLVLDRIVVVDDQYGPGREEYLLAGFVQELQRACSGTNGQNCPFSTPLAMRRFGAYRKSLNPPDEAPLGWTFPPLREVPHRFDFSLGSDSHPVSGQRRFVVALSLIEEDAGGSLGDWRTGVADLSQLSASGKVWEFTKEQAEKYVKNHLSEAIHYVADGVQVLSSLADIGSAVPVVATVIAVATMIVAPIVQDMADDYYGTRAAYLTLESNRAAEVHKLPGALVGTGADRRYATKPQTVQFKGPPAANSAAAFDGIVDIEFHWEFSQPVQE